MADQDTTNISDLPIMQPPITNNKEEVLQNTTLSTQQHQLDNRVVAPQKQETLNQKPEKKKVTFKEPSKKAESFVLSLEHKIIILSTFFFFVFMDTQFKKYILNILVQIFGSFLKSEHGHMTKMGMFVYSLFYGSILLTIVTCIDITSFHLEF